MSKSIKLLTICGSGVVTSSMVANKLKDMFEEEGYDCTTVEANPNEMENCCMRDKFDLIAYVSPIFDNYGVPALNAIGLVTGLGDEEFMEDALAILKKNGK